MKWAVRGTYILSRTFPSHRIYSLGSLTNIIFDTFAIVPIPCDF